MNVDGDGLMRLKATQMRATDSLPADMTVCYFVVATAQLSSQGIPSDGQIKMIWIFN